MLMNGQLWGKFYQTNTQTDQARPKKQQGRNLTGQTRSNPPKAQQDLLHGGPWTQPVERKTAHAQLPEPAGFARLLCLFQAEKTAIK